MERTPTIYTVFKVNERNVILWVRNYYPFNYFLQYKKIVDLLPLLDCNDDDGFYKNVLRELIFKELKKRYR